MLGELALVALCLGFASKSAVVHWLARIADAPAAEEPAQARSDAAS